jgi:hypothetical protein
VKRETPWARSAAPCSAGAGDLDLGRVAAHVGAVPAQDLQLALDRLRVAEAVPDVRVLRHQAQRLALAAAADQHRDLAGRRGVQLAPAGLDPGQCPGQVVQPAAGGAEVVAVLLVVLLEPAGADAQDEPAVADVVDGAGHVRQQLGVAVAVAAHQGADLHPGGGFRPRAQHGPALEVQALRLAGEGEEVIPVEQDVHAQFLGVRRRTAQGGVVRVLGLELQRDSYRPRRHDPSLSLHTEGYHL